jgi:hypothetical protein
MIVRNEIIGPIFDGRLGCVGVHMQDVPEEPTRETWHWLCEIAQARRSSASMLVGIYRGAWIEIPRDGDAIETLHVRQLPDDSYPLFDSPLSGIRMYFSADLDRLTLLIGLSCLFIFDPALEFDDAF